MPLVFFIVDISQIGTLNATHRDKYLIRLNGMSARPQGVACGDDDAGHCKKPQNRSDYNDYNDYNDPAACLIRATGRPRAIAASLRE